MNENDFKAWLVQNHSNSNTVKTYLADAKRVESHNEDFDKLYERDGLAETAIPDLLAEVPGVRTKTLSAESRAPLATSIRKYREYRDAGHDGAGGMKTRQLRGYEAGKADDAR